VLLLRLAKHKFVGGESSAINWNPLTILLAGTGGALWYLPYLLIVLLVVRLLIPLIRAVPPAVVHAVCWPVGAALPFVCSRPPFDAAATDPLFGVYYLLALGLPPLGAAVWGVSVGLVWDRLTARRPARPWLHALLGFGGCATLIALSAVLHAESLGFGGGAVAADEPDASQFPPTVFLLENLAGLLLLYGGLTLPASAVGDRIATLGPATLGIFLIHRPVLNILEVLFRTPRGSFTFSQAVLLTVLTFAIATVLAVLFRKTRWLRWSVG
jgi:hypothetical protein